MHLLNKKSPSLDGKGENVSKERYLEFFDLLRYGSAVFFLLIVSVFFQFFPFSKLHNLVLQTSLNVKIGIIAIGEVVNLGSLKDVVFEVKKVPGELFLGIKQGVTLSSENFVFSQNAVKNTALESFYETKQTIFSNLDFANKKIVQMEGMIFSYLDNQSIKKIVQISGVVAISPETIATSSGSETNGVSTPDFMAWFNRIVRSGLVPVVFTSYEKVISPFRSILNNGISIVSETKHSVVDNVKLSWGKFFDKLFGNSEDISDITLREQLKKEILQELQNGSTATVKDGTAASMYADVGIVLLKQTGSNTIDLNNVKKIQDSFSDRVLVNFDNRETGVIQPIFRDRVGEKYIFVITPVKK